MYELKLLCDYTDWKSNRNRISVKDISEDVARLLSLSLKFDRTEEEEREYIELSEKTDMDSKNQKYTDCVHGITELYNELKYIHDDEQRSEMYKRIGKKQCEIEIMKEQC